MRIPQSIRLGEPSHMFEQLAVGLYLLHMAIMADLTACFPILGPLRLPSFLLVALFAFLAVFGRLLRKGIPLRPFLFYLAYFAVVLSGALYSQENLPYIRDILFTGSFIKYSLIFSALFLWEDAPDVRIRQLTAIAVVAMLVYQLGIARGAYYNETANVLEYMTVGYGMAPWWIILAQGIFYYRSKPAKLLCLLGCLYFGAIIAVYGNRGALVVLILSVAVFLLAYLPLTKLILTGVAALAALAAFLAFLEPILSLAGSVLHVDLTQSRNFRLLLEGELTYDSGRMPIYRACLKAILDHPLLGKGVGGDRTIFPSGAYAHNIILELCVSLGLVAGILVFAWLLYIGLRMIFRCRDRNWRALFLPFYVFSMGSLFFSGSLYESGHLMAAIVIYLSYTAYYREAAFALPAKEPFREYQNHPTNAI